MATINDPFNPESPPVVTDELVGPPQTNDATAGSTAAVPPFLAHPRIDAFGDSFGGQNLNSGA